MIHLFSKIKSNIFIGLKKQKFCIFPYLCSCKVTEFGCLKSVCWGHVNWFNDSVPFLVGVTGSFLRMLIHLKSHCSPHGVYWVLTKTPWLIAGRK